MMGVDITEIAHEFLPILYVAQKHAVLLSFLGGR